MFCPSETKGNHSC